MVWLAVVLSWFILTVLRGRRDRFAFGALLAASPPSSPSTPSTPTPSSPGLTSTACRTARGSILLPHNAERRCCPGPPRCAPRDRASFVEEEILDDYREEEGSWRTWNLGRSRARHLAYSYVATREPPVPWQVIFERLAPRNNMGCFEPVFESYPQHAVDKSGEAGISASGVTSA